MSKVDEERQDRKKLIEDYFGMLNSMLSKADRTATGTTDDKTPSEPAQVAGMRVLKNDGRKLANLVFNKVKPQVIAEVIVTGMAYDVTQAGTRLSKLYDLTRVDCYKQANQDLAIRKARIVNKHEIVSSVIDVAKIADKLLTKE